METVSSKDCSSVDESPISITSSAQVGAPQKKGPMCEPIFVDSSMCKRLSRCSLYSSVDGMRPCPTPWFSVTESTQTNSDLCVTHQEREQ